MNDSDVTIIKEFINKKLFKFSSSLKKEKKDKEKNNSVEVSSEN